MRLLLADIDAEFVSMVTRSIRESEWGRKITVGATSNPEDVLEEDRFEAYDAVLLGSSFLAYAEGLPRKANVMLWVDSSPVKEDERFPHIYKYQPIHRMIAEIQACCRNGGRQESFRNAASDKPCSIIGIYAAANDTRKTRFALQLAEHFASTGYRTFYLNMELAPGYAGPPLQGDRRFAQLLYYLGGGETERVLAIAAKDSAHGFYAFPAVEHYDEWKEYSEDDIRALIEMLKTEGEYDCIVADLDPSLSDRTLSSIKRCDHLIWLHDDEDEVARRKSDFLQKEASMKLSDHFRSVYKPVSLRVLAGETMQPSRLLPVMKQLGMEGKEEDE